MRFGGGGCGYNIVIINIDAIGHVKSVRKLKRDAYILQQANGLSVFLLKGLQIWNCENQSRKIVFSSQDLVKSQSFSSFSISGDLFKGVLIRVFLHLFAISFCFFFTIFQKMMELGRRNMKKQLWNKCFSALWGVGRGR